MNQVEFIRFKVTWLIDDEVLLPEYALLRLRRELKRASLLLTDDDRERFNSLVQPPVATDLPTAHQWPSPPPAFVLHPPVGSCQLQAGDELSILGTMWGRGIESFGALVKLFDALGESGLFFGMGHGQLLSVEVYQADGSVQSVAGEKVNLGELPRQTLEWYLQQQPYSPRWQMQWLTPGRFLVGRRPMFRPSLDKIVPLIFRRIAGILACHCGIELENVGIQLPSLPNEGMSVGCHWRDWRCLDQEGRTVDLGGVLGTWEFDALDVESWLWVLQVGQLCNVGKGSPFGAGQYLLKPLDGT
ncbi:MAG: hypothetical protein C0616_07000 [Desulfuromonas sp.]|nr:MAG: hypothetical protein C0616_07000 [Desulfuromonas sp.]